MLLNSLLATIEDEIQHVLLLISRKDLAFFIRQPQIRWAKKISNLMLSVTFQTSLYSSRATYFLILRSIPSVANTINAIDVTVRHLDISKAWDPDKAVVPVT